MLLPKKVKHRKWHKGRSKKREVETRGVSLAFSNIGLQALENGWINSRQIEASRKSISHYFKKGGKLWIRIFPDKPITKKPPEVTLGGGKGAVDHYVFPVKKGRILFEIDGIDLIEAKKALTQAGHRMPVKTRIVVK